MAGGCRSVYTMVPCPLHHSEAVGTDHHRFVQVAIACAAKDEATILKLGGIVDRIRIRVELFPKDGPRTVQAGDAAGIDRITAPAAVQEATVREGDKLAGPMASLDRCTIRLHESCADGISF